MTTIGITRNLFQTVMQEIDGFPEKEHAEVLVLVAHSEPLVAFETLVTQTYEYELVMGRSTFAKLEILARRVGADRDLLLNIRDELVV